MSAPATLAPTVEISWDGSGDYAGDHDDVTAASALASDPGISIDTGRDGARSLNPPKVPALDVELLNEDGTYSQENAASPVYQLVVPGRPIRVTALAGDRTPWRSHVLWRDFRPWRGRAPYALATGKLDDISQSAAMGARRVRLASLGTTAALIGQRVTVPVQTNIRTDEALDLLLDAAGWPADKRSLAVGDTTFLYWWCDERSPWEAMLEILASEGPGAIWEDGEGVLHFENRNYRTVADRSTTSQGTFYDRSGGARTAWRSHVRWRDRRPWRGRLSGLYFTDLQYEPGFKNIYNRATFTTRRRAQQSVQKVWEYGANFTLSASQERTLIVRPTDPFLNAVTPVLSTDYAVSGGTVSVSLASTSGLVAFLTITATSGTPTVSGVTSTGIQLRAEPLTVVSETTVQNSTDASDSIARFGERTLSVQGWPETDPNQAEAVCDAWVSRYQTQRSQVTIVLRNADLRHLRQILARQVSDRITLEERNTGMRADVWVESKQLRISGPAGNVVECALGCEKVEEVSGAVWDESLWDTGIWGL